MRDTSRKNMICSNGHEYLLVIVKAVFIKAVRFGEGEHIGKDLLLLAF